MTEQRTWRWAALACVAMSMTFFLVRTGPSADATSTRLAAPTTSVAVLNLGKVLEARDERTVREGELQREIESREATLKQMQEERQQLVAVLDTLTRGTPEREAKVEEAVRKQATFEFEGNLAERLIARQRTEMQLMLFNKIKDAAKAYADAEGFDIVLTSDHETQIPDGMPANETNAAILSRRVLHANERVDITSAVAQRMNNEFNR